MADHEEEQYLDIIRELCEDQRVAPRITRNGAVTLATFGKKMVFNLKDNILPLLTTKRVFFKAVVEELLWMIRGSTNGRDLSDRGVHIWDGHSSRAHLDSVGLGHYEEGDIGPCFPAGTPVLTDSGYRNIEDVEAGDLLYTHTGSFHGIEKFMKREYNGDMVEITVDHMPGTIEATPEHPILATLYGEEPQFVEAGKLTSKHFVGMRINRNQTLPKIGLEDGLLTPDAFYMFGLFMAGGVVSSPTNVNFRVVESRQIAVEQRLGSLDQEKYMPFLANLNRGVIPEWVHDAPTGHVEAFLDGFTETVEEGCLLTVVSRDVALSLQRLLLKLGSISTVKLDGAYSVTTGEWGGSFIEGDFAWMEVLSVEHIPVGKTPIDVYNFTVATDNTYTVNNVTVHNCYGFQFRHSGAEYKTCKTDYSGQGVDQLKNLIEGIRMDPYSRRHVVSAWNPSDMPKMALSPCHCLYQFFVDTDGFLHCMLYQRSGDVGLGVPFNIASYAIFTRLIAACTGLKAGTFNHVLGDCHIYENHIPALRTQIQNKPFQFPTLTIKGEANLRTVEDLERLTYEDFVLENYQCHKTLKMKMVV